jgi:hypothetical protein
METTFFTTLLSWLLLLETSMAFHSRSGTGKSLLSSRTYSLSNMGTLAVRQYRQPWYPASLLQSTSMDATDTSTNANTVEEQVTSTTIAAAPTSRVVTDAKEAVKLFGRLAEKYIVLDATAGMCCYSGCTDCEFRLPDGGYRMADQSAARPKWIPSYEARPRGNSNNNESGALHVTQWSTHLFAQGVPVVTREEFAERIVNMPYAPPLGGPYLGALAAAITDTTAAEVLFDVLVNEPGKEKLTQHRLGKRLKELAGGEEGLPWPGFAAALGL